MANLKMSEYTSATPNGADFIPILQSDGVSGYLNKKASINDIVALGGGGGLSLKQYKTINLAKNDVVNITGKDIISVTEPTDNADYTVLLCHCDGITADNTWIDEYGHTLTNFGTIASAGGIFSAYWMNDNTDGYVSISNDVAFDIDGAFSLELFVTYATNYASPVVMFSRGGTTDDWGTATGNYYEFCITNGIPQFKYNNGTATPTVVSATTPILGAWFHLAISFDGTTFRIYNQGILEGTSTITPVKPTNATVTRIAKNTVGNSLSNNGGYDEIRFVKGKCEYTGATITVPTSQFPVHPAKIENSTLVRTHFEGTNNSIIITNDIAGVTLTTNGNAKISTTASKFGVSSVSFDGTSGTYISLSNNTNFNMEQGKQFTIEGFIKINSHMDYASIIARSGSDPARWGLDNGIQWSYAFGTGNYPIFYYATGHDALNSITLSSPPNCEDGLWHYVAVSYDGYALRQYIDGVYKGKSEDVPHIMGGVIDRTYMGAHTNGTGSLLNGYIDEFRFVADCLYTSETTIPIPAVPFEGIPTSGKYYVNGTDYSIIRASETITSNTNIEVTRLKDGTGQFVINYI